MSMKHQVAIFDMDGTILDTLEDLCKSLDYTLTKYGYPLRTVAEMRSYLGNGMQVFVTKGAPKGTSPEKLAEMLVDFKAYYKDHCALATKPYDGLLPMLDRLKAAGMKIAVVSNKGDFAVQILCEQYFPGVFHFALGEKAGIAKKPAPDMVQACLEHFGATKEQAVYIGDSEVDLDTARNAAMEDIIVTWGFRDRPYLETLHPTTIVETMDELEQSLLK